MKLNKVAIHGVPRSGTTWLGAIFDSSEHVAYRNQPLFSYAFKSFLSEFSSKTEIENFFKNIYISNDDFLVQKIYRQKGLIPSFNKSEMTHIIYKEARYHHIIRNMLNEIPDIKLFGIVRDPRSVIYSWFNAPKEFDQKNWNLLEEWYEAKLKNEKRKEEFYGFQKWKDVALMFLDFKIKYPDQFYLVNYSNLLRNTKDVTKDMFDFCGLKLSSQTLDFISKSKNSDGPFDPYSVFRSNPLDNIWKKYLPREISLSIENELKGTQLEHFLNE